MDRTSMIIRSISCKGIKSFNLFQNPSTYAVISVINPSNPNRTQKHKTPPDPHGGENPEWDETFRFDLDGRDLGLELEIMIQGNILLLGDRLVGRVHVPIADLLTEGADGAARHVSYQVVGTDGKANGVIRFSYEIEIPAVRLPPAGYWVDPAVQSSTGDYYSPPPSPLQQYPVAWSSPVIYPSPPPLQQYPVACSPPVIYPPPRQQEATLPLPASYCYPPPCQPGGDYHPPRPPQEPLLCYPPQPAAAGYYPPQPTGHVAYPPPCCYPAPAENWDRRLL